MGLPFPVEAGLAEQRRVVDVLDKIVSRIDDVRAMQQSATRDLSAFMPALLDRAFQGELDFGPRQRCRSRLTCSRSMPGWDGWS